MSINSNRVLVSYAEAFIGMRNSAEIQAITPLASPAPLTTQIALGTTDAALVGGLGHLLALTASVAGLAWTVTEAAAMPRFTAIQRVGTYFLATISPALPAVPTSTSASVSLAYRCIGATDGGISISIDPSTATHSVDQTADPVLITAVGRDTTISVPAAEISMENIAIALGLAMPTPGSNALEIGGLSQTPREFRLLVVGKGTELARRLWLFHRVINDGNLGLNNAKDAKQMLANEFKAFTDTSTGRPVLANILEAA